MSFSLSIALSFSPACPRLAREIDRETSAPVNTDVRSRRSQGWRRKGRKKSKSSRSTDDHLRSTLCREMLFTSWRDSDVCVNLVTRWPLIFPSFDYSWQNVTHHLHRSECVCVCESTRLPEPLDRAINFVFSDEWWHLNVTPVNLLTQVVMIGKLTKTSNSFLSFFLSLKPLHSQVHRMSGERRPSSDCKWKCRLWVDYYSAQGTEKMKRESNVLCKEQIPLRRVSTDSMNLWHSLHFLVHFVLSFLSVSLCCFVSVWSTFVYYIDFLTRYFCPSRLMHKCPMCNVDVLRWSYFRIHCHCW